MMCPYFYVKLFYVDPVVSITYDVSIKDHKFSKFYYGWGVFKIVIVKTI